MNYVFHLLTWAFRQLLTLYPIPHLEHFGEEMEEVFRQKLREAGARGSLKMMLLLLGEVRDLPVGLLGAYCRQRKVALAGMAPYTPVENLALRLRPWVWGMMVILIFLAALYPFWMGWADQLNAPIERKSPVLRGTSALILEDDRKFVRLPQALYHCEANADKGQARCTANVAGEQLQLTITLTQHRRGGMSGSCRGSFAGQPVQCLPWFTVAQDLGMAPVVVQRPPALADVQWQSLRREYTFTFPNAEWLLYGGLTISVLVSAAAAGVIWIAGCATRVSGENRIRSRFWLLGSIATAVYVFIPMAWISLLFSFQLEKWIERF